MIVKLFGIADLMTVIVILLLHFAWVPWNIGIAAAFYLCIKWYMFRGDIASVIDLFVGVYIILIMLGLKTFLTYIFAIYLFQKAVLSLIKF